MNHNVLISGGAGFIGSHVVRLFVTNYPQYHIYNLDILSYAGNLDNLTDLKNNENYTFIEGDICDVDVCKKACAGIDYVLHQTGLVENGKYYDGIAAYEDLSEGDVRQSQADIAKARLSLRYKSGYRTLDGIATAMP